MAPPRAERIAIPGPAGALQALIEMPAEETHGPHGVAAFGVVCHPHPLYGGTLDNKVVYTLARAFQQRGAPAIRFNFRGVGDSAGSYDDGRGEAADALAVIDWGRRRWPDAAVWLAGFSFGGAIAVRIAAQAKAARLVAVAPAVDRIDPAGAARPLCPWLIVQGDADDVVAPAAVLGWARSLEAAPGVRAPQLQVLQGVGHYFHGRTSQLRDVVLAFMAAADSPAA
jgi:uncharacterized protein